MRDKKEQIKRVHISPRKFFDYAKEHNIDPSKMTELLSLEELEQFETGPERFPTGFMPLKKHYKCFICGKKTGWLDKIHGLFMCSETCRDEVDRRYNEGEDFIPHKVYIDICNEHEE